MGEGPRAVLHDRRRAGGPDRELRLHDDRVERVEAGRVRTRIALADVAQVRMSVAPVLTGGHAVHCEITARDGRAIGCASLSAQAPGRWINNAPAFMAFTAALHAALGPRAGEIAFVEGQPPRQRLALFASGLVLAFAAGAGLALALGEGALILGFACGLGVLTGLALAFAFRPVRSARYDPAAFAERMGGAGRGDAGKTGASAPGEIAKRADRS